MEHGEFSGEPEAIWLTEEGSMDRRMELLEDFFYTDPSAKNWPAARGTLVDGASIPRALWTIVGSLYTGDYRRGHRSSMILRATRPVATKRSDVQLTECSIMRAGLEDVRFGSRSYFTSEFASGR